MRCKYCFYHSLANSREQFSYGIMSDKTVENTVKKVLDFCEGGSIYFTFQGGEPLLAGKEFFIKFTELIKKYNKLNSPVYYCLQTNGTLIDREWAEFFSKNNFLLGISLDGDEEADKFRVDSQNNYTFSKVLNALDILKEYKIDFNVLSVATGYTAEHIEDIYCFFKGLGLKYLQFIPCLRPFGDKSQSPLYMTVKQYADYLIRLFRLYLNDYKSGNYVSIREFDNMVRLYLGDNPEQCGVTGHCARQFVIESNGNIYPCDFYCLDEWLLGNINTDSLDSAANSKKAIDFIKESFNYPDKCRQCKLFALCRAGGCKRARVSTDYCEAYKKFFDTCLNDFRIFLQERR